MKCDYCQAEIKEDEEGEVDSYQITGGDESLDLCESCYEHYHG